MAQQLRTDIIIALKADTSGAQAAKASLLGIQGAASQINGLLALGGLTVGAAGLAAFVKRGVEFNSTIESAEVGIAALLRQFQPEKFKNFPDAMRESANAIKLLKKEAATSPATFKELLNGLQSTAGAAFAAKIPLEKQIGLINRISQAAATLGLKGDQIPQEARALFSGNINADAQLAKSLGITAADITSAKASAGGLFDFLNKKLAAFAEASPFAAGTLTQQASNLADVLDDLAGRIAGPLTDALKAGAKDLNEALQSMSDEDIRGIANALADAARGAVVLAKGLIAAAPAAKEIALAAAALVLASKAFNASQTVGGIADNIIAARAQRAAIQGPNLSNFAAFDLEIKNSLNSLSGFTATLSKGIAVGSALFAGWEIGTAIDKATGFSGGVDNFFNGSSDLESKRASGDRLSGLELVQLQEQRLLIAKKALNKATFDAELKNTIDLISAARESRPYDAELQGAVDNLGKASALYATDFAARLAEKGKADAAIAADKAAAEATARLKSNRDARLRVAGALADSLTDPVSQAKAKARVGIDKLISDPTSGDAFKSLGLNTLGDPATVLADAQAKARQRLQLTTLAPGKFTDEQKTAAAANFKSIAELNGPVQDAVKKRAEDFAAASKKLEDSLKSLGETAEQTAKRHLDEATAALAKTSAGSLENLAARQAVADAEKALAGAGSQKSAARFSAADLAGDTARFGAFNFTHVGGGDGLPPGALDSARKTAEATERTALATTELLRLAKQPGGVTFSGR